MIDIQATRDLCARLGIETDPRGCIVGTDLLLTRRLDRLEVRELGQRHDRGVAVDFAPLARRTGNRRQPLARAVGERCETVFDATAGLGQDSFLLATLGYRVTAAERSAVVAALLDDGIARADADPTLAARLEGRLRLVAGDSRTILGELAAEELRPDAIYIDPMYPAKRKSSALAKKSIRLVRALVGDDPDADALIEVALTRARKRVIVKRPHHAPSLAGKPAVVYRSKLVRYDVYTITPTTSTAATP